MNEGTFFQDLAVLMTVVGAVSVIFTRLRWPKVIGYLLAGILMNGHTWGGSFLVDETSIGTIGQLGIVFLMFTLGLEFSAGEMKKVKAVAVPTAVFDTLMMIWIGYTVGREVLGWNATAALFLGAAICDSATTLLAKTIDEMHWSDRPFVRYIFGTTIFEDILCVGVIALITGVAQGQGMTLAAAGRSLGGLAVFFTGVLVVGLITVPRFLNAVGRTMDDEALLLALLGCCFLVSFIAAKLDFSLALGAFLVGILGASCDVRNRLHELAAPLRNMFAAVFFVTIGLLVDPAVCLRQAPAILGLTAVILVGKGCNCFVMSVLCGQRVKDAVQTGFGLAQIGEFAYMVALMYLALTKDQTSPMFQVVVGASLITTCLNPAMLRLSDPVGTWLEEHVPGSVRGLLASYNDWLARYRTALVPSQLQKHIRSRVVWLVVLAALNVAAAVLAGMLMAYDYRPFSAFFEAHKRVVFFLAANLFFISGLAPMAGLARSLGRDVATVLVGGGTQKSWLKAVHQFVGWAVMAAVFALVFAEIVMLNVNLLPHNAVVRLAVTGVLVTVGVFGWKRFARAGRVAGYRFNSALQAEKRRAAAQTAADKTTVLRVPGDFHATLVIEEGRPAVAHTIRELDIRAKTGASVIAVTRREVRHRNPGADWTFLAGDRLEAIGEPSQLDALRSLLLTK